MRKFFLFISLCICMQVFAQDSLSRHVWTIISDSSNQFRKFQGSFQMISYDSIYHSTFQIEGTKDNNLRKKNGRMEYYAEIAYGIDPAPAASKLTEWQNKLKEILGPSFAMKRKSNGTLWSFEKGNLVLEISMWEDAGPSQYTVDLTFILNRR